MKYEDLASEARNAMKNAYSPYSHFSVGAALLCRSGKVYTGCNIENASYTPTVCAERVAFFKAVSDGEREFEAIAIAGGADGNISAETAPCGVCRQVMSEFCGADFKVILVSGSSERELTLGELLPLAFALDRGENGGDRL